MISKDMATAAHMATAARIFLAVLAITACSCMCGADRVYVSSSEGLFTAFLDSKVDHISLTSDIVLKKDGGYGKEGVTLLPGRRILVDSKDAAAAGQEATIAGWRLLDFSFISSVIHLSSNVSLTFTNIIVGGTRAQRLLSYPGQSCAHPP